MCSVEHNARRPARIFLHPSLVFHPRMLTVRSLFMDSAALLALLRRNARTNVDDLARELNVSEEDVSAEINRLEKEGLILGYQTILDSQKLDAGTVTAVIEVRITPERGGGFDRLASRIARFDEVQSCYLMSGVYDLLVVVEGKT